jgi:hypothetical protein
MPVVNSCLLPLFQTIVLKHHGAHVLDTMHSSRFKYYKHMVIWSLGPGITTEFNVTYGALGG